jgi:tetratricopeptide (TPR) repeat protein
LASSYASLGGVLGFRAPAETFPRSKELLMKALPLDENLAELHSALATYALNYEWNWPEAERRYKRAIELNPNFGQRIRDTELISKRSDVLMKPAKKGNLPRSSILYRLSPPRMLAIPLLRTHLRRCN